MFLDAATAKALATVIMLGTIGADALKKEQPLQVEDRGALWLVRGTLHTDDSIALQYVVTHVFLDKATAEVKGFEKSGRMILSEAEQQTLLQVVTPDQLAHVLGPPTFEPREIAEIYRVLYGGVVNRPAEAVAYAHVLLSTDPTHMVPAAELRAEERDMVWHVVRHRDGQRDREVLTFSRATGKLLSGDL